MQLVYAPGFLLPALSYISHVQSVKIPNVTFRTAFQRPSMLLANITVLSAHIIHLHTALHVLRAHGMNKDARDTLQHVQSCSLCQTNILFPHLVGIYHRPWPTETGSRCPSCGCRRFLHIWSHCSCQTRCCNKPGHRLWAGFKGQATCIPTNCCQTKCRLITHQIFFHVSQKNV